MEAKHGENYRHPQCILPPKPEQGGGGKKMEIWKSAGKKSYSNFKAASTATGGGPPPTPVSPVTDAVVDCIGRESAVLNGIGDISMDSTYIQLLDLEPSLENGVWGCGTCCCGE